MATFGSGRWPQPTSITSAPQLVTPSCTGPLGVCAITGPPLSPGQAMTNGGAWCAGSAVQSIVAWIARGYAFLQSLAPSTLSAPCCSGARGAARVGLRRGDAVAEDRRGRPARLERAVARAGQAHRRDRPDRLLQQDQPDVIDRDRVLRAVVRERERQLVLRVHAVPADGHGEFAHAARQRVAVDADQHLRVRDVRPSRQCAAVRMRVGEISVPVHCPPSQATYGACSIGTVVPPDTACAGAAASGVTSTVRTSFTRMTAA